MKTRQAHFLSNDEQHNKRSKGTFTALKAKASHQKTSLQRSAFHIPHHTPQKAQKIFTYDGNGSGIAAHTSTR
jgi:hypothetical protein